MANPNDCYYDEQQLIASSDANVDIQGAPVRLEVSDPKEQSLAEFKKQIKSSFAGLEDKEAQASVLREVLSSCQPQEGTPTNTFTRSELEALQAGLSKVLLVPLNKPEDVGRPVIPKLDICSAKWPGEEEGTTKDKHTEISSLSHREDSFDWYDAPNLSLKPIHLTRAFRHDVRTGRFTGPTNAQCPGFLQCNLVVLPQGPHAYDFLLFCQRNPKACPLIEVCDTGSAEPVGVAPGADLRTDIPMYSIYRDGKLEKDVQDVTDLWPSNSVAFLIGCSFSYDGALMEAGIPLRSAEQKKNVPMYTTSLKCRSAGSLHGNMVVSMKPISALQIARHIEITSKYKHAHGGPVCVGNPDIIGLKDIEKPEWGEAIDVRPDEIPVFHACGVTPQSILMESKVPFAITHKAGHMFVTDMPSDMGC